MIHARKNKKMAASVVRHLRPNMKKLSFPFLQKKRMQAMFSRCLIRSNHSLGHFLWGNHRHPYKKEGLKPML